MEETGILCPVCEGDDLEFYYCGCRFLWEDIDNLPPEHIGPFYDNEY